MFAKTKTITKNVFLLKQKKMSNRFFFKKKILLKNIPKK